MKALREAISALELYDVAPGVKRHSHEDGDASAESGFWIGTLESKHPLCPQGLLRREGASDKPAGQEGVGCRVFSPAGKQDT